MIPAIAFRRPQNLSAAMEEAVERLRGVHIFVRLLPEQDLLLPGGGVDYAQFQRFGSPLGIVIEKALAVLEPFESRALLKRKLEGRRFHVDSLARGSLKHNGFRLGEILSRQRV